MCITIPYYCHQETVPAIMTILMEVAMSKGYIDDIIEPSETRKKLIVALKAIYRKREDRPRRKHGNIPV